MIYYMVNPVLLIVSLFLGILIGTIIWLYIINRRLETVDRCNDFAINILQSIACDYKVRISQSKFCNIYIPGNAREKIDLSKGTCIEENTIPWSFILKETRESLYAFTITFKLYGKQYVVFASEAVTAWCLVVQKARIEHRKMFLKY